MNFTCTPPSSTQPCSPSVNSGPWSMQIACGSRRNRADFYKTRTTSVPRMLSTATRSTASLVKSSPMLVYDLTVRQLSSRPKCPPMLPRDRTPSTLKLIHGRWARDDVLPGPPRSIAPRPPAQSFDSRIPRPWNVGKSSARCCKTKSPVRTWSRLAFFRAIVPGFLVHLRRKSERYLPPPTQGKRNKLVPV